MSGPPPPPRNKHRNSTHKQSRHQSQEEYDNYRDQQSAVTGAGYNAVRQRNAVDVYEHGQYGGANVSHQDESHHDEANMHQYDDIESESYDCSTDPISPVHLLDSTPETTIGINVVVRGELEFESLLRIDGLFTGKLISKGDLIIGSQGKLVGNVTDMGSLLVDGKIVGNINVGRVCLRGQASVFGDITCKSIQVEPTVVMVGKVNIHSEAPQRIDSDGNVVASVPETQVEPKRKNSSHAQGDRKKSENAVDGEKMIAAELAAAKAKEQDQQREISDRAAQKQREEREIAEEKKKREEEDSRPDQWQEPEESGDT
mmetsp:Transcript_14742/g.22227  ORF Transcript_14742/g.22227 Transcript_14742/m.22227 type:complete len:315 (-) Transcript_14742:152-1096(-)|eukprot:CAMPEP_0185020844 /NCGR_PEP_ID=MMETSP1103-20130426/3488_1 /TAXON_ID=36769 /ORGANISM="Paraphysomonas bandaiensis, Strain Caron Lab Isolate" /LENGTH=314 /DNA_ID=CAMNT_0027551997 /DNA_START=69 /DNA_END=1013 /DNA_ORIENTATION=-